MKKIISVSRRTDIPAFYGEWFLTKLKQGSTEYKNPFSGRVNQASLLIGDVACFVFWSKNFIPFTRALETIKETGYNFYFNYTINNYPKIFEPDLPEIKLLLNNLKYLSDTYSPETINWRYDPVIISDITDFMFHINNFKFLAEKLKGYAARSIISFVSLYRKVLNNFEKFKTEKNIAILEPEISKKIELANILAEIASENGIKLYSCCSEYLVQKNILRASCIDGKLINDLFYREKPPDFDIKIKPTRPGCCCYESVDIGEYNTCKHYCVYCYANYPKKD